MNKESGKNHALSLKCIITKGEVTDVYIGQIEGFPGITAYGKTKQELKTKLLESVNAYFSAFPEEVEVADKRSKIKAEKVIENLVVEVYC
jgi:hypothetical protein